MNEDKWVKGVITPISGVVYINIYIWAPTYKIILLVTGPTSLLGQGLLYIYILGTCTMFWGFLGIRKKSAQGRKKM